MKLTQQDTAYEYRIAASILDCNFLRLQDEVERIIKLGIRIFHIDVMDGAYVPNISFGQPVIKSLRQFKDITLGVHLMIKNPERSLESFIQCRPDILCVHAEECSHLSWALNRIRESGIKPAVALSPATPLSVIENVFPYLDMVLIMTVNPGFGGQKFLKEMIPKISRLKEMIDAYRAYSRDSGNIDIEVDGGINADNALEAMKAGANIFVLGTAIYKSENPGAVVKNLLEQFKLFTEKTGRDKN